MLTELLEHKSIDGMLIDSFTASVLGKHLHNIGIRTDRMMDYPIIYGIRMAKGSERLTKCLRKYLRNHPQEVFDMLRRSLNVEKVRIQISNNA